ncbi:MAG: hydrogenase maturation protease [Anaerolineales bacterium]
MSWQDHLSQSLTTHERVVIVGVGNVLYGDDGAGEAIITGLQGRYTTPPAGQLWLYGGTAPENLLGKICDFNPGLVILIDALDINAPPGSIHWLDWAAIDGISATTHSLPLTMLGRYLEEMCGAQVAVLGIRAEVATLQQGLSAPVAGAVEQILTALNPA